MAFGQLPAAFSFAFWLSLSSAGRATSAHPPGAALRRRGAAWSPALTGARLLGLQPAPTHPKPCTQRLHKQGDPPVFWGQAPPLEQAPPSKQLSGKRAGRGGGEGVRAAFRFLVALIVGEQR